MSLKFFTDEGQAKEYGRSMGAPKGALAKGTYLHNKTGNKVFYIALGQGRPDAESVEALQKLINAYGMDEIISALNSGLSLAAGVYGRNLWGEAKPGTSKADRSLE